MHLINGWHSPSTMSLKWFISGCEHEHHCDDSCLGGPCTLAIAIHRKIVRAHVQLCLENELTRNCVISKLITAVHWHSQDGNNYVCKRSILYCDAWYIWINWLTLCVSSQVWWLSIMCFFGWTLSHFMWRSTPCWWHFFGLLTRGLRFPSTSPKNFPFTSQGFQFPAGIPIHQCYW